MEHPVDSPISAGSRFLTELAAWVFATWAAARISVPGAVAVLAVLVLIPSVFNVPGDKRITGIAVGGLVRVVIELSLFAIAATAPFLVLEEHIARLVVAAVVAAGVVQIRRWAWLVRGGRRR